MRHSWLLSMLIAFLLPLKSLAQVPDMQTDLTTTPIKCRTFTIIFAIGTGGADNFGSLPGQSIAAALIKLKGAENVALQGVEKQYYPAVNVNNLANMDHDTDTGGERVADLVQIANSGCAKTKMILMGYSQGAGVQHKATQDLSPTLASWISSVLVFGDVYTGKSFGSVAASKIKSFCAPGDPWCDPKHTSYRSELQNKAHTSYIDDTDQAVQFILTAAANGTITTVNGTMNDTQGGIQQVGQMNRPISHLETGNPTTKTCTRKRRRSSIGKRKRSRGRRGHLAKRSGVKEVVRDP